MQAPPGIHDTIPGLETRVDHLHAPLSTHPDAPLETYARYTRIEILAAMGIGRDAKIADWQSGVYEAKAELLALTLDKSSGGFSPTTRYRDYAMSRTLIHWESQSSTRADGATGLRYRNHDREGRTILLFTRLRSDQRAFWFLGPATYRSHIGERPMAITWELHHPLPATSTLRLPPLSHSDEVYGSAQLSPIAISHGVSQHPSRRRFRLAETTRKRRPLDE